AGGIQEHLGLLVGGRLGGAAAGQGEEQSEGENGDADASAARAGHRAGSRQRTRGTREGGGVGGRRQTAGGRRISSAGWVANDRLLTSEPGPLGLGGGVGQWPGRSQRWVGETEQGQWELFLPAALSAVNSGPRILTGRYNKPNLAEPRRVN